MKNWKTTLIMSIVAILITAQTFIKDGMVWDTTQILQLIIAIGLAGFGVVAKDFDKSGK